jgi:hypothetical protein
MPLRLIRTIALVLAIIGALGSVALMVRAGQRTPRFLLVLFVGWVLMPFVVLLWANIVSTHWSAATRIALLGVTLVIALGSVAIYGELVDIRPQGAANAFPWVITPPAAMLLIAVTVPAVALIARRRYRRGGTS